MVAVPADPDQQEFSGTADITVQLDRARDVIWLHGRDLRVSVATARAGGETFPARYEQVNDDGVVRLTLPRPLGPGEVALHFAWSRTFDPNLAGLYLSREAGATYASTQFESISARRAFPCFDEPRFKTPFDVTLVVPSAAVAIANTQEVSVEAVAGAKDRTSKRIRFARTLPLPTYLLAWAVGPFDVVEAPPLPANEIRGWQVPVRGVAPRGRGGELAYALRTGSELLLRQEQYFGIPFPYPKLDQVAVPDFAWAAMENAGEIHYREEYLLFQEGRSSEESRSNIASILAHEQAHQWFGDLVTMDWWTDAWLNEAFATWFGQRTVEEWQPAMHAALELEKSVDRAMVNDSLATARAIRQPLTSVKNIVDQFDQITYQKGGGVLAMFERFVGADAFRRGVSAYLTEHAHGSGSTDDLLRALSKSAGRDLDGPFRTFLEQAGLPLVQARVSCGEKPAVTLAQSRYLPLGSEGKQDRAWQLPVCVRYSVAGVEREQCTLLDRPEGSIPLAGCPDWLLPNAAAAGYYRWSLPAEDLAKLRGAGYPRLSAAERVSLAQNTRSAVFAGKLPIADGLAALEPFARDEEGDVAEEALPLLLFARSYLLPGAGRPLVDAYAAKLLGPAVERLGFAAKKGEALSSRGLRAQVIGLLARAKEPRVLQEANRLGLAYAGLEDGRFHPEAVDADLAQEVLGVAVEQGGAAIFDGLVVRLATTDDGDLRRRILFALARAADPERSARALRLSLDPRLRKQEVIRSLLFASLDERTRDAAWGFTRDNLDQLLRLLPAPGAGFLPFVARRFCEAQRAEEVRRSLEPRTGQVDGLAQNLRQAVESIRLCAAQAEAQRGSAERFFAARAGTASPR